MSVGTYSQHFNARQTPQTQPIPGSNQVPNSAGGFCFEVNDWTQLNRWLLTGSQGGTYYVTEKKLTIENADVVVRLARKEGLRLIQEIVRVSVNGLAPKNDPAIFALAIAAAFGDTETKQAAYEALPQVCRIGTHLFQFVEACKSLRGWGKGLRRAIARWYADKPAKDVAYQCVKYQQREGWSHRDVLRLSHPKFADGSDHNIVANWAVKGWNGVGDAPHEREALLPIWAFERAKRSSSEKEIISLIRDYRLPRECIPTQWLNGAAVWEALLEQMPITAMVRNLGKMTAVGLLKPLSQASRKVVESLGDEVTLKRGRVHPLSLLVALKTYQQGHGDKGQLSWSPVQEVVNALDESFYLAYGAVQPTRKRWLIGIDVSASMSSPIAGTPLSCCEAATALALVTAAIEPWVLIGRFNEGFEQVPFTKKTRLDEALRYTRNINGGGTDCSMPMLAASRNKLDVDAFLVITDNETNSGRIHPSQALKQYRKDSGIPAKLLVNAMTATPFSIADSADAGMADFCGFGLDTPQLMSSFIGYSA